MRKIDLIKEVSEATGVKEDVVKTVLDGIISGIENALIRNDRLDMRGFGNFVPVARKAKVGRNITRNEEVHIPATIYPKFLPSKELKNKINKQK